MKKIAVIGGVDCGKSTFISRLLNIYKPLLFKNVEKGTEFKNTDTLRTEVENSITAVSSRYYLNDDICIINCPGHYKFVIDTLGCIIESDYIIHIVDKVYKSKEEFISDMPVHYIVSNYINYKSKKVIVIYNNKNINDDVKIDNILNLNLIECSEKDLVSIIDNIDDYIIDINIVKKFFNLK